MDSHQGFSRKMSDEKENARVLILSVRLRGRSSFYFILFFSWKEVPHKSGNA
jgi:hypothetical protein